MTNIKFRLAKPSDAKAIAYVHLHIRDKYDQGFFAQVNFTFLVQYYKVMLNDPYEVIVCAENPDGKIVGFSSGSLDAQKQMHNMQKNKLSFIFPLISSALLNPKIIQKAFDRFKSTSGRSSNKYISADGSRLEYWGWLPNEAESEESVVMQDVLIKIMNKLGAKKLYFEVDDINKKVLKFHKLNSAKEISKFTLPDGRIRRELYYDLSEYPYNFLNSK